MREWLHCNAGILIGLAIGCTIGYLSGSGPWRQPVSRAFSRNARWILPLLVIGLIWQVAIHWNPICTRWYSILNFFLALGVAVAWLAVRDFAPAEPSDAPMRPRNDLGSASDEAQPKDGE